MIRYPLVALFVCSLATDVLTQGPPPGGAPRFAKKKLVQRFDKNKNARLDSAERAAAIEWIVEDKKKNPPRRRGRGSKFEPKMASYKVAKDSVATHKDKPLYDTSVVRTMFLDFANPKHDEHMKLFYRTDIDEPATLTVDGDVYEDVGVHYRGSSSYFTVVNHPKKSMSISLDYVDRKQRIGGFKTMNLLSAHADPSFMRTVLFAHICGGYIKMTKASFVHLVINGESWGLYINDQQLNKDFVEGAFGTRKGARWKMGPNFKGEAALFYQGAKTSDYATKYELKSASSKKKAWAGLIGLCKLLSEGTPEQLEADLPKRLNIEHTLWFLALDNVLMDGDGYHYRGSDYAIYMHPDGQFYPLFRDNNEAFGYGGGPGGFGRGGSRRGGPGGAKMDPVALAKEERAALCKALLSVPKWRKAYLDRCRTIRDTWLDWNKVGPIVKRYRELIEPIVKKDEKSLYGYDAFVGSLEKGTARRPGLRRFLEERRKFLDEHEALKK